MSKQLRLDVAQLTDVGRKRSQNEDNMAYVIPKDPQVMARKGALFIVADGMGGHAAGEVASEIAVDTVSNSYYQDDSDEITVSLMNAIRRANSLIHQRAAENMLRSGMGTTCVAAVLRGNTAYIANVGDSRAYLVRNSQIKQVSQDHSWVEEQVRAGLLTKDQARSHAQRNVITRCLGTQSEVEIDVFSEPLEEGDSLILCTDGLSGLVGEEELQTIVTQHVPQESVYHLVERANENGGSDNITAIVIRVLEVGWEPPPNNRYPVPVGGREIGEDSAITLGRLPGTALSMPARTENGRVPSSPLRSPSGPLFTPNSVAMQAPPVVMPSRSKRNRLLYPTVAVSVLLLVALVGIGVYYFFLGPRANVDTDLAQANTLISQAKANATSNPTAALQELAQAQILLREAQTGSLSDSQRQQFTNLNSAFTSVTNTAITNYNQQGLITTLPCVNAPPATINTGSTPMTIGNLAMLQDGKGATFSYTLGEDHKLYQIDTNHRLVNPYTPSNNAQVSAVASDPQSTQRLLVLTAQGTNATATYSVVMLTADQGKGGILKEGLVANIDTTFTRDGQAPRLMTAWGGDVYIVLTSAASPNQATILDYNVDDLKAAPQHSQISISTSLTSVAAFPNKQLFLLSNDGNVQSLQFFGTSTTLPGSVLVQSPIVTPLAMNTQNMTLDTSIATPVVPASPAPQQSFLTVPAGGVNLIMAGSVNNTPHLYIVDVTNHRVLDLVAQSANTAATPTVSATTPAATATRTTNTASNTKGTPTTAATTKNAGGGVAGTSATVMVQLSRQYASPAVLALVKGVVLDPTGTQLNLLTQTDQRPATFNIVQVNVTKNACTPAS